MLVLIEDECVIGFSGRRELCCRVSRILAGEVCCVAFGDEQTAISSIVQWSRGQDELLEGGVWRRGVTGAPPFPAPYVSE